jgi:hypothetical protein
MPIEGNNLHPAGREDGIIGDVGLMVGVDKRLALHLKLKEVLVQIAPGVGVAAVSCFISAALRTISSSGSGMLMSLAPL